mmetsp:Transcript_33671/g.60797  ORF Transcript_33671/g.60797 Transcript_33671/m.60797 type:complete len:87 (-) Transcript_33671:308-568(-)
MSQFPSSSSSVVVPLQLLWALRDPDPCRLVRVDLGIELALAFNNPNPMTPIWYFFDQGPWLLGLNVFCSSGAICLNLIRLRHLSFN